ncbi:MAG: SDR family NAD(P)-dependent oxidoreductase [Lachnospiraceae bacterium]|nr:SDR family NAD(P)-dependent oxidoreductase [Lachnospiraceae bacterium]
MNIILITGASSGIGREFARQMDAYFSNMDEFWLIARRKDLLQELAGQLQHKCRLFAMDITQEAQQERLRDALEDHHAVVRMLINCAGYGTMGHFAGQNRAEQAGMIRLNCEALTNITHICLPHMCRGSRIIQLSSSAAFLPQTDFAVYAATKSYVLSLSKALSYELNEQGIYVTAVCPGPVDTPFFEIAEKNGSIMAIKKLTMVSPERVVALALKDSYFRKKMSVCSPMMKLLHVSAKLLPHELFLSTMKLLK